MKKFLLILFLLFFSMGLAAGASAMPILSGSSTDGLTWEAEDDYGRNAEAEFEYDGSTLTLILKNNGSIDTSNYVPNQVLTGLFFDSNLTLGAPHVFINTGSSLVSVEAFNPTWGSILDGEYGWLTNLDGSQIGEEDGNPIYGQNNGGLGFYGLAATGFDPEEGYAPEGWTGFGKETVIDKDFAYDPEGLNGAEFGLVNGSEAEMAALVASIDAAVWNAIRVEWTGLSGDLVIDQVNFLYGTDYETSPVPEPATMLLLGTGLLGLAGLSRKKFFKK